MPETIELEDLLHKGPAATAPILGLLYYEAKFGLRGEGVSHAALFKRLTLAPSTNHSQVLARVRARLKAILPVDAIEGRKIGRESYLALRQPLGFRLTLAGQPVGERALASFLGIETSSDGALRAPIPEAELCGAMRSIVGAELNMTVGHFTAATEGLNDLRRVPGSRASPRMALWSAMHEMRLLRLSEEWVKLGNAARRARRRAEEICDLPKSHGDALLAAAILSEGWVLYDRARSGVAGARFEAVLRVLETMQSRKLSANNLWVYCERYNLLALVLRRMAVAKPIPAADIENRREWARQSLAYNHDAIELASVGGNLHSLSTYASNRAMLVAVLAGAGLVGEQEGASPWHAAIEWLSLSDQLCRWIGGGSDITWSGPYLLTIVRKAEGHVAWPELRQTLNKHCRWYQQQDLTDLIGSAIAFAQPAAAKMLDALTAGTGVARFQRQLLVFCKELAHAAQRDGISLADYEALHPLRAWASKLPKLPDIRNRDRAAFLNCF